MDPLLEAVLRKDPEKTRRSQEVEAFLSRLGAERKAKLAETSGVLDLLTLHPALKTGQALRAKSFIPAGANALAFASQFGDDMLSRALGDASVALPLVAGARGLSSSARAVRGLEELAANAGMTSVGNFAARRMGMDVGGPGTDQNAAIPVYEGVTTTGKLRQMALRAAEKGKDLPQFTAKGKISPGRQRKIEKDMRAWIPMLGSKDPEGQLKLLDDWVKNNPFWGKYPLEKGPMLDLMPAKLRPAMNFALMNSGYGGINMGPRTALGSRGEKLGTRARNEKFSEIQPFSERKFEEIMPYYMSGNLPAGWAAANPGRQPSWIARPGEKLAPGQRNILDEYAKAAGGGGTAAALGAGIAGGMAGLGDESSEDDQAAVPGRKKFLRRLAMAQNPRLLEPLSNEKVAGAVKFNKSPQKDPLVWGAQRFENLADILPGRQQRRGMYYTLAEPRPAGQTWEPRGMYQHSFADLLKPGSEGGSRGVLGDVIVRNPLLLPGHSFFGNDAPRIIGGNPNKIRDYMHRGVASDIRGANSWEELNRALPKKYRLNNTDIRNFKNDPNRPYSFNDTVGDLLISKFLKNEGYDAGIPRGVRKSISRFGPANVHQSEVVFPAESRWDLRPQFQPNWKTLESWAGGQKVLPPEVELGLLKRGIKPGAGPSDLEKAKHIAEMSGMSQSPEKVLEAMKIAGGLDVAYDNIVKQFGPPKAASKLDTFAKQMGVEIPQGKKPSVTDDILDKLSATKIDLSSASTDEILNALKTLGQKPKMTKADRIAKWGNPGFKEPTFGKVLFTLDDFMNYRLPNKSAVAKKLPSGTFVQDYFAPVSQVNDVGGPQFFSMETLPYKALSLGKKGAKPYGGTYYPPVDSPITSDEIEELKKLFNVSIPTVVE